MAPNRAANGRIELSVCAAEAIRWPVRYGAYQKRRVPGRAGCPLLSFKTLRWEEGPAPTSHLDGAAREALARRQLATLGGPPSAAAPPSLPRGSKDAVPPRPNACERFRPSRPGRGRLRQCRPVLMSRSGSTSLRFGRQPRPADHHLGEGLCCSSCTRYGAGRVDDHLFRPAERPSPRPLG